MRVSGNLIRAADARPAWRAVLLLAGVAGLLLATIIAGWMACPGERCVVPDFDRAILQSLHGGQTPLGEAVMMAATWMGSMYFLLPAALLVSWRSRRNGGAACFLPVALIGGWVLVHAAKWLVERPRPDLFPALVQMPADASFPSGHAAQAAIFVAAWLATRRPEPAWAFWLAGAVLVLLVAISRPYLQVHFPTDVIAGLLFGLGWVALLNRFWPGGPR